MTCEGTDITREADRPLHNVVMPSCWYILEIASKKPAKWRDEGAERCGRCCFATRGVGYKHASADSNAIDALCPESRMLGLSN